MKFVITDVKSIPFQSGSYKKFTLQCVDHPEWIKESAVFQNGLDHSSRVGDVVDTYYEHWTERLARRLRKIGIKIQMVCNYPWIYLEAVNGVRVKEIANSKHGFCIGYYTQNHPAYLNELFNKIWDVLEGQPAEYEQKEEMIE